MRRRHHARLVPRIRDGVRLRCSWCAQGSRVDVGGVCRCSRGLRIFGAASLAGGDEEGDGEEESEEGGCGLHAGVVVTQRPKEDRMGDTWLRCCGKVSWKVCNEQEILYCLCACLPKLPWPWSVVYIRFS